MKIRGDDSIQKSFTQKADKLLSKNVGITKARRDKAVKMASLKKIKRALNFSGSSKLRQSKQFSSSIGKEMKQNAGGTTSKQESKSKKISDDELKQKLNEGYFGF